MSKGKVTTIDLDNENEVIRIRVKGHTRVKLESYSKSYPNINVDVVGLIANYNYPKVIAERGPTSIDFVREVKE